MSIVLVVLSGNLSRSSSSMMTNWFFPTSYPFNTSLNATTWSSVGQCRCCLIGSWQWGHNCRKDTALCASVARYMRTGIATIPKLIAPRHMDRAIPLISFFAGLPGLYGGTPKRCSDGCLQRLRVERAQRFVLEIGVDVAATRKVAGNSPHPGGSPLRGVGVAPQPQVDERAPPDRPRLFLPIAVDERRTQALQQGRDLRRVPGAVAELEGDAPLRWEQGHDPFDPAVIEGRGRRQLKEDRAQPIAEGLGLLRQHPDRLLQVGHAAVVRDAPVGLHREAEIRRDASHPTGDDALRLRPIEGGVDLDR